MRLLIASLACSFLALSGCVKKGNPNDPDSKQKKATVIQVETQVRDTLQGNKGDFEDWKAIEIKEPGKLRISVLMGNPDCQCSVAVLDADGKELAAYENFKKEPRFDVPVDKAKPGYYFVQLRAKKDFDYSAYLIETVFRASPKPVKSDPEPDPDPVVTNPDPTKPDPNKPDPTIVEAEPIAAKITKSKSGRAGYIIIVLDKGTKDGVTEGATGTIDGVEKGEFKIIKVTEKTSEAESPIDAKAIKGKSAVTIQPAKK
jgi:hypothetical protein